MPAQAAESGLRERKKERTRQLIADTARRLFAERGFEAVPVAEIAREAEVSEATVFNYFPTKEDIFYSRLEAFEDELLANIRDRGEGESVLQAFGRFIAAPRGLLAARHPDQVEHLAVITRVITESPALLARERQIYEQYTAALADALTAETGAGDDDIEPWAVARTLIGLHRTVVDFSRREILAGTRNPTLARRVRRQTQRALELVSHRLSDYGVRADAR
jgi:AcrR family transcriptional regulator